MLALILAAALTSPFPAHACAWWSRAEQRCRDADVESLGPWDPRPPPGEWTAGYSTSIPADWPAHPLEKRIALENDR